MLLRYRVEIIDDKMALRHEKIVHLKPHLNQTIYQQ